MVVSLIKVFRKFDSTSRNENGVSTRKIQVSHFDDTGRGMMAIDEIKVATYIININITSRGK